MRYVVGKERGMLFVVLFCFSVEYCGEIMMKVGGGNEGDKKRW